MWLLRVKFGARKIFLGFHHLAFYLSWCIQWRETLPALAGLQLEEPDSRKLGDSQKARFDAFLNSQSTTLSDNTKHTKSRQKVTKLAENWAYDSPKDCYRAWGWIWSWGSQDCRGWEATPLGGSPMHNRASHHEATFSKSLAWVFFWCLFMFRNDLKNLKNLGRSFHDWKMVLKITNPHYRVKIQNCRRPMVWPNKFEKSQSKFSWVENGLKNYGYYNGKMALKRS